MGDGNGGLCYTLCFSCCLWRLFRESKCSIKPIRVGVLYLQVILLLIVVDGNNYSFGSTHFIWFLVSAVEDTFF